MKVTVKKTCSWCAIYGIYPTEKAYRPAEEVGALDDEGNWICDSCLKKYRQSKAEERQRRKGHNQA